MNLSVNVMPCVTPDTVICVTLHIHAGDLKALVSALSLNAHYGDATEDLLDKLQAAMETFIIPQPEEQAAYRDWMGMDPAPAQKGGAGA